MSFQARCVLYLISIVVWTIEAKIFERCELARELHNIHDIPMDQLATWVCIAFHESRYDTAARNPGSGDHGIFQISEHYWCSASGDDILACGLPCSAFEDDDIEDDVVCARRAYRQHQRLSGNGFNAWSVYRYFCTDPVKVAKYIAGCFGKEPLTEEVISNGTRVPKQMFFIKFKFTKHFEDGHAATPKPTSTTNTFPSFIPVIVPGGCYTCNNNNPINVPAENHSYHYQHHHYHHVYVHNESSTFRPNVTLSSTPNNNSSTNSQNTQQFSEVTASSSVATQQASTTTISFSNSTSSVIPQSSTTASTNRPFSTSTTSATTIISIPSRPSNILDSVSPTLETMTVSSINGSHHLGRPQLYQHHNYHFHHHTTKKPLNFFKPKNELSGKQFEETIKSSKNEIVSGRSAEVGKKFKSSVFQPLVTYSQVKDSNYQYSLNSNGFKLRVV